jgi:hypothetical protein
VGIRRARRRAPASCSSIPGARICRWCRARAISPAARLQPAGHGARGHKDEFPRWPRRRCSRPMLLASTTSLATCRSGSTIVTFHSWPRHR